MEKNLKRSQLQCKTKKKIIRILSDNLRGQNWAHHTNLYDSDYSLGMFHGNKNYHQPQVTKETEISAFQTRGLEFPTRTYGLPRWC